MAAPTGDPSTARRVVTATAPTRLDFGGGWTDVPPYPEERGGFVCNLAIERRATAVLFCGATDDSPTPASDNANYPASALVQAALRRAGRSAASVAVSGVELTSDFPIGAGLGGSSAAGVALAAALAKAQRRESEPGMLAEWSRAVEVEELGVAGGRQDHYAAAFGGALALTFGQQTAVERIPLSQETVRELERRILVIYTGESRISGDTINAVLDAYTDGQSPVVRALDRMKALAMQMRDALALGTVDELASLVDEHWAHQRSLHAGISTVRIDALDSAARAGGACGVKALGASGGGSVIVFTPANDDGEVARAVAPWGERVAWRVAHDGVQVRERVDDDVRFAWRSP